MSAGVTTFTVGKYTVHALEAGRQRLDGGAMFGVVPKTLWLRRTTADEKNRIPLAMRSLLIEHDDGLILVETGLGNKETPKFLDIYGIDNAGADGRTTLEDSLALAGYRPEEVRTVIDTHLHFDHAGGNTFIAPDDAERRVQLAFPNAQYLVHRREYEWATHANERTQASYFLPNYGPVLEAGRLRLLEGPAAQIVPGVRVMVSPGHTPWLLAVLIESDGEGYVFPSDTVPTSAHLPLPWIMGYDVEPLRTLESKRALYQRGIAEGWRIGFVHDPQVVHGRMVEGEKGIELGEVVTIK